MCKNHSSTERRGHGDRAFQRVQPRQPALKTKAWADQSHRRSGAAAGTAATTRRKTGCTTDLHRWLRSLLQIDCRPPAESCLRGKQTKDAGAQIQPDSTSGGLKSPRVGQRAPKKALITEPLLPYRLSGRGRQRLFERLHDWLTEKTQIQTL